MKAVLIEELMTLDVICKNKVIEYVDFCLEKNQGMKIKFKTSHHHILPNAIFEKYSNLKEYDWNGVHLLHSDHYYAHYLLIKAINSDSQIYAFISMHNKDFARNYLNEDDLIDENEFQLINENRNKLLSMLASNRDGYWKGKKLPYDVWNKGKIGLQKAWNKDLPSDKQPFYGKNLSDEHKKSISKANSGNNNYWRKNKMSDEHKLKNSESNKLIKKTVEWNKKNSEKRTGTKLMSKDGVTKFIQPEDFKSKISEGWKFGR